jgi:integrase/recombinase XerD
MTNTIIPPPATTLCERMIEDMKLHRLCRTTQHNYLRDVSRFAIWLGRPPNTATDEDLRRYLSGFSTPVGARNPSTFRNGSFHTTNAKSGRAKLTKVRQPSDLIVAA